MKISISLTGEIPESRVEAFNRALSDDNTEFYLTGLAEEWMSGQSPQAVHVEITDDDGYQRWEGVL